MSIFEKIQMKEMNKTKVQIMKKADQCMFNVGDIGYIDGYVRGGDNRPYAVVVIGGMIDLVIVHNLRALPTHAVNNPPRI